MPTLEDIADNAGVSKSLVAEVLSGRQKVSRPRAIARADLIRKIAKDMGYVPNHAAVAMSTGRFHSISFLSGADHGTAGVNEKLMVGIWEGLQDRDFYLSCAQLPHQQLVGDQVLPRLLRQMASDGFLIDYRGDLPEELANKIDEHGLPAIWLNEKRPHDCVYPDDEQGSILATRYLLERGSKKIAFLGFGQSTHFSVKARRKGYSRAMLDAGFSPLDVSPREYVRQEERQAYLIDLLRSANRPEALVCYSPGAALPAYTASLTLGLKTPDELSIVSFNHERLCVAGVPITTMSIPVRRIGSLGVNELIEKIRQPDQERPAIALAPILKEGVTT